MLLESARSVLDSKDESRYAETIDSLGELALSGDGEAAFLLGLMHLRGQGTKADVDKACELFMRADDAGNLGATFALGMVYAHMTKSPEDLKRAFEYFRKVSENSRSREAQYEIGLILLNSEYESYNPQKAYHRMKLSADAGNVEAMFVLGQLLKNGYGTAADAGKAEEWLLKAADGHGHRGARILLGDMYWYGDGVQQDRDKGREYYELAGVECPAEQRVRARTGIFGIRIFDKPNA